jgi:uncharacterized phage protein (TIGR02218 family)
VKPIAPALQALLDAGAAQLAYGWRITRADGQVFAYTSHDADAFIPQLGLTCLARPGFSPSAVDTREGLNVDNLEVQGIVLSFEFTEAQVMAGLWDGAAVLLFQFAWADPALGIIELRAGTLGEFEFVTGASLADPAAVSGHYRAELRGLMQPLQQTVGELISPQCRAQFGDARCGITPLTELVYVPSAALSRRQFSVSLPASALTNFDYGKVTFFAMGVAPVSRPIKKTFFPDVLTLFEPAPFDIMPQNVQLTEGCDHQLATCCNRFNNGVNFRGEPHLPGQDKIMQPGR